MSPSLCDGKRPGGNTFHRPLTDVNQVESVTHPTEKTDALRDDMCENLTGMRVARIEGHTSHLEKMRYGVRQLRRASSRLRRHRNSRSSAATKGKRLAC